jgi:hypothetical protein
MGERRRRRPAARANDPTPRPDRHRLARWKRDADLATIRDVRQEIERALYQCRRWQREQRPGRRLRRWLGRMLRRLIIREP